tara:strand:- start:588 stop:1322 length:735 start_codon:yes stop_codon:yes gene_type:complete
MKDNKILKSEFIKKGYFKIDNFFSKKFIDNLNQDIINAKNVDKYYDINKNLRRIERLYDKGEYLKILNDELINYLSSFFKKKIVIFKDKLNAKPVGGEGFDAHYDGIFYFTKKDNLKYKGWYNYSSFFVNVLIAFDECNAQNGALEIANADYRSFKDLIKNTRNDGTPKLNKKYASSLNFKRIDLDKGDVLFFSNLCPHKSKKNLSDQGRKILYYTYAESSDPNIYYKYFEDKSNSISNKGGAL